MGDKVMQSKVGAFWGSSGWKQAVWVCLVVLGLSGCEKPPVQVHSAEIVTEMDGGSGNFDRMLKLCFDQPLEAAYWHQVTLVTQESFQLSGGSMIRPKASDPDDPCHLRVLYHYIDRNSPPGARKMIQDYVVPGNIDQLLVQIYPEKPTDDNPVQPLSERLFENL